MALARRRSSVVVAAVLTAALFALLMLGADQATAIHVSCGDVITTDTTLDSDLTDCPGDGVVIGAEGITLDLNGHTIAGPNFGCAGDGVNNRAGYAGVTIEDGVVKDFGNGVAVVGASGNVLRRLSARGCGTAMLLIGSRHNVIAHNATSADDGVTIYVDNADGNLIAHNTAGGGGIAGIMLTGGSDYNRVLQNQPRVGILVPLSGTGIRVDSGTGNLIARNRAIGNARRGIHIAHAAVKTLVERNVANETGSILKGVGTGIEAESLSTTLTRNTANHNGDLGIKAVPGVKDGGGNRASGNGNPAQCEGVACSP